MSVYSIYFNERVINYCKSGGLDSRTSLFECVAAGDLEKLEPTMQRYFDLLRPLLGEDIAVAKTIMQHAFAQLQLMAAKGGVSLIHCLGIQDSYYYALDQAKTVDEVVLLLQQQCREFSKIVFEMKAERAYSDMTRRCCEYIRNHLYEDLSLSVLAEALAFSESYLSHRFRKETGMSIQTFIRTERISEAKHLLRANYSTAHIASLLGFSSQSYFTYIFKRETGMTPTQFRKTVE